MDSDDISRESRFREQLRFLENNRDCGLVGSWISFIDESGKPLDNIWKTLETDAEIKSGMVFGNQIAHPTVMLRRSAFGVEQRYKRSISQLYGSCGISKRI